MPQLNELRQLELNYQRYRIDVQLQRYERALGHIVKCGAYRSSLTSKQQQLLHRVTTCLENLEMSGILTAVSEMSGILLNVRELSGKNIVREKLPKTVYC